MERAAQDTAGLGQRTPDEQVPDTAPTTQAAGRRAVSGLEFHRFFTLPGVDPFDEVT